MRVCGLATCDATTSREPRSGTCRRRVADAFTVLHDAFLAGGALVQVPDGVVVDEPIVVLHWSEGDGLASFPHTLVVAGDGAEVDGARALRLAAERATTSSTRSSS